MSVFSNFLDGGAGAAEKANKAENAWLKGQYNASASLGESLLMKALAGIDSGYESAKANLGKAGETTTMQILGQGKQALAAGQQALTDSGFSGTIAAQLPGQVANQTNQALGQVGEALGAQSANLDMQHANAKFSGASAIANWALNKANTANAVKAQYQASGPGFIGSFSEALGKAAGSWATGFIGGV